MTKYESQNNIKELHDLICKRLKYIEKNLDSIRKVNEIENINLSKLQEANKMIELVREKNNSILSEYYINISKTTIENSLKEAGILDKLGKMSTKVPAFNK